MAQNEQKEILKAMGEIIDQKVMPELKDIKKKLVEHDKKFENIEEKIGLIIEGVGEVKIDITEMQEDVNDLGHTTQRIETRLNTVVHEQDNIDLKTRQLGRRVLHLESKKA